jgi:PAS domain S-box-containing protein
LLSLALAATGAWIGRLLWNVERGRDQLERSEARLKMAQQMARVGHWELDLARNRLTWSDEVYRVFGQSQADHTPSVDAFMASVHPDDVVALRLAFDHAFANRIPMDHVHRIVRPDGGVRHVRLLCETDYDDDQPVRYRGTVQDVTELHETQRALEQLNAGLEQRVRARTHELVVLNRDLESFTYSVSHDLRTPLRSIHGFATVLGESEGAKLSEEGRTFLGRIQEGARRMGLLINDLLAMAQQSRAELKVQRIHLSELARTVAADLARTEPARQVHWSIEDGLWVQADPGLMTVVMQNLLGNAWKYTGHVADARISLTQTAVADGVATFRVRDNGAGFDMRYADQLFQPFKRLHRMDEFEGTGVGLASVQRILQRHGGSVRGEGQVGQGASFWFSLPVEPVRQFVDSTPRGG